MTKSYRWAFFLPLALAIITAALSAQPKPEDLSGPSWATWRGPNGNSMVADTVTPAAVTAAKVLWTASVGPGYAAVHTSGKLGYTTGRKADGETLVCLDLASGKALWDFSLQCDSGAFPGSRATPVVIEGKVYCMNRDGVAYCLDALNGKLVWKSDVASLAGAIKAEWGYSSSAVRFGDLLVFNVGANGAAIRIKDGKLAWKSQINTNGYASAVPFTYKSQSLAFIFGSSRLHVINPQTGESLASVGWNTAYDVNSADPLVVGSRVLVSSDYGKGAACFEFDGKSLEKNWENKVIKSHFSSMVENGGYVYGNDGDANASSGSFVCLEFATGKEMWRQTGGVGSLIAVGKQLLTLSERGRLALAEMNPKAYTELAFAAKVGTGQFWPAPTIAGGKLFVRNNSGMVSCIDVSN